MESNHKLFNLTYNIYFIFRITLFQILRIIYIKGEIFVCVRLEYLTFDIFLHAKFDLLIKFIDSKVIDIKSEF